MQYIYDVGINGNRKETTTTWQNALKIYNTINSKGKYIAVHKELEPTAKHVILQSKDDFEDWQIKLDREAIWKPKEAPHKEQQQYNNIEYPKMQYSYEIKVKNECFKTTKWEEALKIYHGIKHNDKHITIQKVLNTKLKELSLYSKTDIEEWQSILDIELPKKEFENKIKINKTMIETLQEIIIELGLQKVMIKNDKNKEPLLKETAVEKQESVPNDQIDSVAYNNYFNSYATNKKPDISLKDHINPSHYQSFFGGTDQILLEELQWLETIQYTKQYRNPEIFKASIELQARKYLDRLGGKDAESQEIKKAIWYLKFLAAYIANDNKPIRVKNIDSILGKI